MAKDSGFSITTVSRVINNNYPVSATTRKKIEASIKKLDFTPNPMARGLIQNKTNTIGVLIPSIINTYFAVVVSGIQDYFKNNGYYIILNDTGGNPKDEAKYLDSLLDKRVDGIISIDPRTVNIKNNIYQKASNSMPLIIVNGFNKGVKLNFVLNNQECGTSDALQYLISLGHKNIYFVRGKNSYSYDIKEVIFRDILSKNNLPLTNYNIITIENGNSIETVDLTTAQLYKSLKSKKKNYPTAIFCCNDFMGVGALHACQKAGLSVPDDISIIGYDNTIISQMTFPKLTTVDQNMYTLGKLAAEQLHKIIDEPTEIKSKIILDTKLIIRDSCKKIN